MMIKSTAITLLMFATIVGGIVTDDDASKFPGFAKAALFVSGGSQSKADPTNPDIGHPTNADTDTDTLETSNSVETNSKLNVSSTVSGSIASNTIQEIKHTTDDATVDTMSATELLEESGSGEDIQEKKPIFVNATVLETNQTKNCTNHTHEEMECTADTVFMEGVGCIPRETNIPLNDEQYSLLSFGMGSPESRRHLVFLGGLCGLIVMFVVIVAVQRSRNQTSNVSLSTEFEEWKKSRDSLSGTAHNQGFYESFQPTSDVHPRSCLAVDEKGQGSMSPTPGIDSSA